MLTKQERAVIAERLKSTEYITSSTLFKALTGEEGTNGESYDFACSACGWCGDVTKPNYCPNCGARVVRDEA